MSFEGACDLAELFRSLAQAGQLAAWEATQRFYEIGSPAGLFETEAYLKRKQEIYR